MSRLLLVALCGLLAAFSAGAQSSSSGEPEVSYRSRFVAPRLSDRERVPATPALWSAPVAFSDKNRTVGVGGGVVVHLWRDTLIARDLRTGRVRWKKSGYGEGFAVSGAAVAALSRRGELLVADLGDGRERWRRRVGSVSELRWLGTLLAFQGVPPGGTRARITALEGKTGRLRVLSGPDERLEGRVGNLILTGRANSIGVVRGFRAWDVATGKRRWSVEATRFLRREGETLYFQRGPERLRLRRGQGTLHLLAVNARTGRGRVRSVPLSFPEVADRAGAVAGEVRLDGECVWAGAWAGDPVGQERLHAVACHRRDGGGEGRRVTLSAFSWGPRAVWLGGPLLGRLWFTDEERQVWSGKVANVRWGSYPPHGDDTRLSRFDVTGGRVVVASTDGQLLVYDPDRSSFGPEPLVVSRHVTGSRFFGPSVILGGLLLVQGEEKIEVFRTR